VRRREEEEGGGRRRCEFAIIEKNSFCTLG